LTSLGPEKKRKLEEEEDQDDEILEENSLEEPEEVEPSLFPFVTADYPNFWIWFWKMPGIKYTMTPKEDEIDFIQELVVTKENLNEMAKQIEQVASTFQPIFEHPIKYSCTITTPKPIDPTPIVNKEITVGKWIIQVWNFKYKEESQISLDFSIKEKQ